MGLNALGGGRSEEEIEDIVGAMAEAGYGLEYDDAAGLIAATRRGPNPYDAAQSFTESDLSLSQSGAEVANGGLRIAPGTKVSWSPNSGGLTYSNEWAGAYFNPNTDMDGVTLTYNLDNTPYDPPDVAQLRRSSDDELLAEKTGISLEPQDTVTLTGDLKAGTEYYGRIQNSDGDWYSLSPDTSYPISSSDVDITGKHGVELCVEVRAQFGDGSATLEWPEPLDVYKWDVATFTKTLDGETVDVFVAYNDGSGWARTNGGGPIDRNYSLADDPNISPSDEVRIEAELSRDDVSNNPTLDSAYRSWVL